VFTEISYSAGIAQTGIGSSPVGVSYTHAHFKRNFTFKHSFKTAQG